MRAIVIGAALALFVGGNAFAAGPSKCDSGITKAEGKKASCKAKVYAKAQALGGAPDAAKLAKCTDKFTSACTKAQAKGDCMVQSSNPSACAAAEAEVDNCALSFTHSPSPAFLE